jgi:hypothetical protein
MALKVSNKNRKVSEPVIDPSVDYTGLDYSTAIKWSKYALLGAVIVGLIILI